MNINVILVVWDLWDMYVCTHVAGRTDPVCASQNTELQPQLCDVTVVIHS